MEVSEILKLLEESNGSTEICIAENSKEIPVSGIPYDPEFLKYCEGNQCGGYGKNHMCPPRVGNIHELIANAKTFSKAVVFQNVYQLEDSFDFEGMMEAHADFAKRTTFLAGALCGKGRYILLGAGKCQICEECTALNDKPCVHPDKAYSALECYGIYVAKLLEKNGMKYNNGEATVSYVGLIYFD